jgi:GTP cyclohydrolase II
VLEPRTIPTATGAVSTAQPSTGRALDEAITAMRRGEPVLIRDHHVGALAVAAELVTEENLHRLRKISQGPASMVLTRRRAVALGLTPREELCGAMTIPVSFQLPAVVIRNLADPAASVGTYLPSLVPEPVVAESAELAVVALAKLASLFPTAFVLLVGAAQAALLARRGDLPAIEASAVFKRDAGAAGLDRVAEARVPLADAETARLIAFRPRDGSSEHLAI